MKKSIAYAAVAVIVVAGARWHYSRGSVLTLSPAEKRSLHDVPNDTPDDWGFNAVQGQTQGLMQGAKAVAQKPVSGQSSGLQKLLQEEGVSVHPGENAYDALRDLFEKGQAPSQADVTGSFSGQTFRDDTPDQGSPYGLVGHEVAGTVSHKFELVFSNHDKNPEDGDLALSRLLPDYDDSETSVVFGDNDVKVKWQPGGVLPGAPVWRNLKVRKVGPCLVAAEQVDHLLFQGKPDWLGYFCR